MTADEGLVAVLAAFVTCGERYCDTFDTGNRDHCEDCRDRGDRAAAAIRAAGWVHRDDPAERDAISDREFGNLRWLDGHVQGVKDGRAEVADEVADRLTAAIELVQPDHLTPMGARQIRAVVNNAGGERRG